MTGDDLFRIVFIALLFGVLPAIPVLIRKWDVWQAIRKSRREF